MLKNIINEDCYKLNIINYCNNNCYCCNNNSFEEKYYKDFLKIIEEIKTTNKKNILIYGGEPTLYPVFFKLINLLKNYFQKIILLTNGRIFSNDLFLNKIINFDLVYIIKLNASNSLIHDKISKVNNSFNQTIQGITKLVNFKQKVYLKYNLNDRNFLDINNFYLFINKLKISGIILEINDSKNYEIYRKKFDSIFLDYKKNIFYLKYGGNLNFNSNNLNFVFDENPKEICFEVTARCNLSCRKCFNKIYYNQNCLNNDVLSFDDIKKIIDKIPVNFVSQIRITGGEPLLREDIFDIFKYIKQKGFKIWLNTNATLIDENIAKRISKYVDNVLISLNGYDKKSEKNITGLDSFYKKIQGIKLLQKYNVNVVRCGTMATEENIKNLKRFYLLVLKLGLDSWELYRLIDNKKFSDIDFEKKKYNILFNQLDVLNRIFLKNFKVANSIPLCISKKAYNLNFGASSDEGHIRFVIGADGSIRPSYFIFEKLGNIFIDDLNNVWNFGFLKKMRDLKFVTFKCRKCIFLDKCLGGSRYYSKLFFDEYKQIDPLINKNFYNNL